MTREDVLKRKTDLEEKLEQHLAIKQQLHNQVTQNAANLQATSGAIQDCEWWLDRLEGKEGSKEKENFEDLISNGQENTELEAVE